MSSTSCATVSSQSPRGRGDSSGPAALGGANPGQDGRVLGTVQFYNDPVVIELPQRVVRGVGFTVTVWSYGGGCISRGDTQVELGTMQARILPSDHDVSLTFMGPRVCTLELRLFEHSATVRFDQAGVASVAIRGVPKPSGEVITISRDVIVE